MLLPVSRSRRPGFCAQLIRYFSIRVPPLKKQSLVAQLLRGKASPKLASCTQKEELLVDVARHKFAKAIPLSQQGEASLRSVHPHPPLALSAELAGAENGRQKDDNAGGSHIGKHPLRLRKGVHHNDVVEKVSAVLQLEEVCKADAREGKTELNGLSKLPKPFRIKGNKAHRSVGAPQLYVEAQPAGKRSDCVGKPFHTEERELYPLVVSVRSQEAGEEDGRHSHSPVETKAGGKGSPLQFGRAFKNSCLSISKLGNSPLNAGSSKESSCLVPEGRDERADHIQGKLSISQESKEDEVQNAVKDNLFQLKTAVEREISKRSKLEQLVELYSKIIQKEITDTLLHDRQWMSTEMDRFFSDLQQKIDLVRAESVTLIHFEALLVNREFLSALPEQLAKVLTLLKQFFESQEKVFEILARNPKLMVRSVSRLQERLNVLLEFEVDKSSSCRFITTVMTLSVKKLRKNLSLLKDLGVSTEFRNRMVGKDPLLIERMMMNPLPSIENFFESREIARLSVLKLLEVCPRVILTSSDKKFRVVYELFQHVGLSTTEYVKALGQMSHLRLDVFSHYDFFRKQGLSDETFARMIVLNPNILCQRVSSLEAKLHFLLHETKWDLSDAVAFPRYFSYHLANRIIPRCKLLEQSSLSRRPSLSTVIASSGPMFSAV